MCLRGEAVEAERAMLEPKCVVVEGVAEGIRVLVEDMRDVLEDKKRDAETQDDEET